MPRTFSPPSPRRLFALGAMTVGVSSPRLCDVEGDGHRVACGSGGQATMRAKEGSAERYQHPGADRVFADPRVQLGHLEWSLVVGQRY